MWPSFTSASRTNGDDENHKFFVSVELIGVFEIVGPVTDEDKKEIHVRTYQQVSPMLRCWSSRCAPPAAMPNFMLLRHKMDPDHVAINRKK